MYMGRGGHAMQLITKVLWDGLRPFPVVVIKNGGELLCIGECYPGSKGSGVCSSEEDN